MGAVLEKLFIDPAFFGKVLEDSKVEDTGAFFDTGANWFGSGYGLSLGLSFGMIQLLFQGACYAYVLMQASSMIGDGSELLLLTPYRGLVGSVVLPVLGAVPDGAIILFSGATQKDLAVGVGALAGSTIMLLTVPWSLAIIGGRVDLGRDGMPDYKKKPRLGPGGLRSQLTSTGACVDRSIPKAGGVMAVTALSYFLIQIPALMGGCGRENCGCPDVDIPGKDGHSARGPSPVCISQKAAEQHTWALYGLCVSAFLFVAYIALQYAGMEPEGKGALVKQYDTMLRILKERERQSHVLRDFLLSGAPKQRDTERSGLVSKKYSTTFEYCMNRLFAQYNTSKLKDNFIDQAEIATMMSELSFQDKLKQKLLKESKTKDGLQLHELKSIMWTWAKEKEPGTPTSGSRRMSTVSVRSSFTAAPAGGPGTPKSRASVVGKREVIGKQQEQEEDEEEEIPEDIKALPSRTQQQRAIWKRALTQMGVGTGFVILFADPLVGVLGALGDRLGVPAFYISFILAPLASNGTELLCAYNYAVKKTKAMQTTAISSLLGAACMNNTFCLAIFLLQIWQNGFVWEFTAETIAILAIELLMIIFAVKKVSTPLNAFIILSLFPLSVALVYILEKYAGLD